MPLLTTKEKQLLKRKKAMNDLVRKVERFTIKKDDQDIAHIIRIDLKDKRISVSHPNYEALKMDEKKAIARLKTNYGFYIAWEFYLL